MSTRWKRRFHLLCSVPLGIQNNNDERLNKNKSKTKTVSVSSSEEGTEISSIKSVKHFLRLHPYGSGWVKPGVLPELSAPLDCKGQECSVTF